MSATDECKWVDVQPEAISNEERLRKIIAICDDAPDPRTTGTLADFQAHLQDMDRSLVVIVAIAEGMLNHFYDAEAIVERILKKAEEEAVSGPLATEVRVAEDDTRIRVCEEILKELRK